MRILGLPFATRVTKSDSTMDDSAPDAANMGPSCSTALIQYYGNSLWCMQGLTSLECGNELVSVDMCKFCILGVKE